MAKSPKKPKLEDIETEPDAWERFERVTERIVPPRRPKQEKPEKPQER